MNDDWTERLRKRLENYEVEPPPELWEAICEKMGIDPVRLEKKPAISRWWWAAAAAVLVLVGCFVIYEVSDSEQPLQAAAVSQQQTSLLPSSEPVLAKQSPSQQQEDIVRPRQTSLLSRSSSLKPNQGDRLLDSEAKPESRTCPLDSLDSAETIPLGRSQVDRSSDSLSQNHGSVAVIPELYPESTSVPTTKQDADAGYWTIGLNASGGLLAANSSNSISPYGVAAYENDKISYAGPSNQPNSATSNEPISEHRLPVRFGLSLHYQLNPRLALLCGISYTRLYSEFSFLPKGRNISYSQRLHYIGVPFSVAWQLWKANRFSFYCSGGVMVEKCVSVDLDSGYSGSKPWQWSFNAAAGAEFALTSQFGVYLEPSLGYYFSDGTQLEHYYKEHPLAPSIEFGLRMHLGR